MFHSKVFPSSKHAAHSDCCGTKGNSSFRGLHSSSTYQVPSMYHGMRFPDC